MELTVQPESRRIHLYLSRRNLETLLSKLDRPESHRSLLRDNEAGWYVIVTAEENGEHYGDRAPGPVHPADEPHS